MRVTIDGEILGSASGLVQILALVFDVDAQEMERRIEIAPFSTELFAFPNGVRLARRTKGSWYLYGAHREDAIFKAAVYQLRAGENIRLAIENLHAAQFLNRVPLSQQRKYTGLRYEPSLPKV